MTPPGFAVLGATRGLGLITVQRAQAEGLAVRALIRPTSDRSGLPAEIPVYQGDCRQADFLHHALEGCATVAVCLGVPPTRKPVTLFSETVASLMSLRMKPRILLVTGIGAGDSRGHGGFFYDRILNPLLLGTIYADKERAEALLASGDGNWVVVRPGFLTNGPETGHYRILTDLQGIRCGKIARADVAHFLVSETQSPKRNRQAVLLTY